MGYRGKVEEQNRARDLRAMGWTLAEIAEQLGVSKSSASLWCRDVQVDEAVLDARRRERYLSGNEGARQRGPNKLQRAKQAEIDELREAGRRRIGQLSDRDLLIAGLMLYAGEGAKRDGMVVFANTNPDLMRLFCAWLRRFFEVDEARLRVRLYLHAGLDLDAAIRHWASVTGIPPTQFLKSYRAATDSTIRQSKHPLGCASVVYSCSRTHRSIMGMLQALVCSDALPG